MTSEDYNKKSLRRYINNLYVHLTGGGITPTDERKVPSVLKEKIWYFFGVPEKKLRKVKNLGELINITILYKKSPSPIEQDLAYETEELLSLKQP